MHCAAPPVLTIAGLQLTETDVIDEGVPVEATETTVEPLKSGCCVLVAVTVTVPDEAGAVNTPLEEMDPALADQVTVGL